jgi:hypothetical protein
MRLSIEYGILNTLLNYDKAIDSDLNSFLDYQLDHKLFKANRTTKLVSKAISNHLENDTPFTTELIERYILKRANMNLDEWIDLIGRGWFTYATMEQYIKVLKEMDAEEELIKKMQEIG